MKPSSVNLVQVGTQGIKRQIGSKLTGQTQEYVNMNCWKVDGLEDVSVTYCYAPFLLTPKKKKKKPTTLKNFTRMQICSSLF